ncbi:MAG: amino acid adenylation domain-containing protein [Cyanobacteria bacterium J06632_3]
MTFTAGSLPQTSAQSPSESTVSQDSSISASNLTTAQRMLWLGQKLAPASPLYNMAFTFTLSGEIDPALFQQAFQAVLDRCDALRMVIDEVDGVPQRRVLPPFEYRVPVIQESSVRDWAKIRTKELFNLSERLFDTALICVSPGHYVWYLNQHHLITDVESVKQLFQTVGDFYARAQAGTLNQATALPAYAEVSDSPVSGRIIKHWQKQQPTPVEIYHRQATQQVSSQTHRVSCELGQQRTAALEQLAAESEAVALTPGLSLFNVVATVLIAYLHRVSGQQSLAIATPANGRPTANLKDTIGLFIELFPLLADIAPDETFATLLGKVNEASGLLFRRAKPGASEFTPSRNVNIVLNFIQSKLPDFAGHEVRAEWIHAGAGDAGHHLRLQVHDLDNRGSLQLHFDFSEDLFDRDLQRRAPGHFLSLMDAILSDRTQPIAHISLLHESETTRLKSLGEYEKRENIDTPTLGGVVQQFEAQVARTPDAIALSCESETFTYQQLNTKANQLAHYLRQQGIEQESPVGIYLRRSPQLLIAIWAVLKAGGAYVPLDPSHPRDRVAHILKDTQVCHVLTHSQLSEALNIANQTAAIGKAESLKALCLDTLDLSDQLNNNLPEQPTLNQLAYLLYTSGSTGQPKGVAIEHRSLANYVQWAIGQYVRGRSLAFPLFSPLTFDLTVTSIYVPLLSGGQIVVYPETADPIDLSLQRIFQENIVDVIKLTPSHLTLVQGQSLGSQVKTLILGGEDLKASLANEILKAYDANSEQDNSEKHKNTLEIYNEYGPTEATVGCMIQRFNPDNKTLSVPIGQPAAGSHIYLLDSNLNLVPEGSVGEIFIGGPGLARGYLNRPELTATRFIDWHGQRLYRTGDLGRWLLSGELAYLGRCDRQVKIQGHRIELGEIEAALAAHPQITASAVTVIEPKQASLQTSSHQTSAQPISLSYCTKCGLASNYPGVSFDDEGVCDVCQLYDTYKHRAAQYFRSFDQLRKRLEAGCDRKPAKNTTGYDCMMLLSGGKDSTYALAQLVQMGYKVFAFTLDNGYISEGAKDNIRRVVSALEVDHMFGTTPAMNEIFVDSLERHCNVCNGCFKTIYTLSMQMAYDMGIPTIVTGLSRGQFFETRLSEEWFTQLFGQAEFNPDRIDETILEARKVYHRSQDAVSEHMNVDVFKTDDIFEMVEIVDFYRYCDVELAEMLAFLREKLPWIRPADTGRSTNCLINNAGIYVHTQERGYHNYALPYSWDVRMGHKTVEECIDELNDEIDTADVERILSEIGYRTIDTTEAQLAAYYVSATESTDPASALTKNELTKEIRAFLTQRLPKNLVPSHFVSLTEMPLTANGKVDFAALPDPREYRQKHRQERQSTFVSPQTAAEKTLARLWQQVLQTNRVGLEDDFFELGGDSIMAIQIAARMAESGFNISPNQIFQHSTLGELAAVAMPDVIGETQAAVGSVPLTPIQQAFFELASPEPDQFTQTVVLEVAQPLRKNVLQQAIKQLRTHHDSLRLSFRKTDSGWQQQYEETVPDVDVLLVDVAAQVETQRDPEATITQTISELQRQLSLTKGDLIRVALFDFGEEKPQQIAFVVHHLAIDAVSWQTLLKDLETLYQSLNQQETAVLPLKTSAFKTWAEGLRQVSASQADADYWLNAAAPVDHLISVADFGNANNTPPQIEGLATTLSRQLSDELTQQLLQQASSVERPQEMLLVALATAVSKTAQDTTDGGLKFSDTESIRIDLEGHGREETIVPNARLVRTVGWFTSVYPVTLSCSPTVVETLQSVKTTLRAVPQHGIGYGILRYLGEPSTQAKLKAQPKAEILFNYLGPLDQLLPPQSMFTLAQPLQVSRSRRQPRSHLLDVSAFICQGRLQVDWCYSGLDAEVVASLANNFIQALEELLNGPAETTSAEDFPLANLDTQKLDKLSALLDKADGLGGLL